MSVSKSQTCGWVCKIPRSDGTIKTVPCGSWSNCQIFADWYTHHRTEKGF